jgi:hypothetical protein
VRVRCRRYRRRASAWLCRDASVEECYLVRMDPTPLLTVSQRRNVRSLSLDRNELRKLLEKLQERCAAAGAIEAAAYQPLNREPTAIEKDRQLLREGFKLFVTLEGKDRSSLTGSIGTIFDSPNFPTDVRSVFFNSETPLRSSINYVARNRCVLFLDFTRPEALNFSFMPSQETPNASNFDVQGSDATWVNGVFLEFDQFVKDRPSTVGWLHRHTTYDVLLWLVGYPFAFWCSSLASSAIQRTASSAFVQGALYVYTFLVALVVVRCLFHYARWIWPLIEFRHPRSKSLSHKAVWSSITLGLLSKLLYDLLKRVV